MKTLISILILVLSSVVWGQQVTLTTIHSFTNTPDGDQPCETLIADGQGGYFGTTEYGGLYGQGEVFRVDSGGNESAVFSFAGGSFGAYPQGRLMLDGGGNLWGVVGAAGVDQYGLVYELMDSGGQWQEIVIYNFLGYRAGDGAYPESGLVSDGQGDLYGTTAGGGLVGAGTVYQLSMDGNGQWTEKVLYSAVEGATNTGGISSGVIVDGQGNLYATTESQPFELAVIGDGSWVASSLHTFSGKTPYQLMGLTLGSGGVLYGTTIKGGHGHGIVYSLTPPKVNKAGKVVGKWTEKTLYSFVAAKGSTDGNGPMATVMVGADGSLYGTTIAGGSAGYGTVYKLTPQGTGAAATWQESVLWSFGGGVGGMVPAAGVVISANGDLLGTACAGGSEYGGGTVWQLSGVTP